MFVCLHVPVFVCKYLCSAYLWRGLTQNDEMWQDCRPWWDFGLWVSPQGQKVTNFGNAHLVDRLRDRAEILQAGGEAPATGFR